MFAQVNRTSSVEQRNAEGGDREGATHLELLQSATKAHPAAAQHGVLAATGSRSTLRLHWQPWGSPKAHRSHMNCTAHNPHRKEQEEH